MTTSLSTMVCRVLDYAMRLETCLWARSGKGGRLRGSCNLGPGKAACCPRRRHWHHPLQIPWRIAQRSAPLRPCPRSRRLSSRGWWRLPHVLRQRVGAGLIAGPLNKALLFVASKLSTTPVLARQKISWFTLSTLETQSVYRRMLIHVNTR